MILKKLTVCWRCNKQYDIDQKQCPHCEATNANVDTEKAVEEMKKDFATKTTEEL